MQKLTAATAICLACLPVTLQAAPINPTLDDVFAVRVGPFFSNMDTKIRLGDEEQNFEDYLDDNKTTLAIDGVWRIARNWRLRAGYWGVSRDGSEALDHNTSIGGITIPAGTAVNASLDTSLLGAALGWSFVATDTTEFGVEVGLAGLSLKSDLGTSVPGLGSISFTAFDETYPLPTIGAYLTHALSPQWTISGRLGGMGLEIGDDFKGNVIDAMAAVEFRPWTNVGLGVSYLYTRADAELKNIQEGLEIDWIYQGPFAYLTLGFGNVR